jgi:lysophospholipase L1-like esterase
MAYMKDVDGNRLDALHVKGAVEAVNYRPDPAMTGPVATDSPTVTTGVAGDGTFNEVYAVTGGALPAIWPVDVFGQTAFSGNLWFSRMSSVGISTVSTYRFMCDGSEIVINTAGGANFWIDLYIDGRPYTSNPITAAVTPAITPLGYQKFVFGSAKPRLIELRMAGGLAAVYTKKPYRIWKPPADTNPSIAAVGDSYVAPVVHDNTTGVSVTSGLYQQGLYQRMAALLGIRRMVTDGIAGTGYTTFAPAGQFGAAGRLSWLTAVDPDVIVAHDGFANDLNGGASVAQCITAGTAYFTTLRTNHPNAKLVFVEGIAPPGFTPSTYNPNYIAARQGLQTALDAAGVENVYYLDVATTRPPISGSGYVTAPNGTGNSDIYIGTDQAHPTVAGHTYLRNVFAPKIARVLADDGTLAGTLID